MMIENVFIFIFGAIVGSFLNVCIYRMPLGQSVVVPRSFCPNCKKTIPWFDNVPFLSYILLGGKCRSCKQKISPRYLLVELLTALMFLWFYNYFGLSFWFLFYVIFGCGLVVSTFVDIKHRIIPDEISVGGLITGFVLSLVYNIFYYGHFSFAHPFLNPPPALNSFLGIIVGGGVIYLTGILFDFFYFKVFKKPPIQGETESMGGGDVKLLAMIGAFLGWKKALFVFFLAPFLGIIFGLINLVSKKDHTMPYGPFLSVAAFLSIFWARDIVILANKIASLAIFR
ncbi:MAG: prepilin peptidase [Candidatus Omnitrophica bacterium]|nr:prepilin peptidase [Candidatus Omnitrophota bacterium]